VRIIHNADDEIEAAALRIQIGDAMREAVVVFAQMRDEPSAITRFLDLLAKQSVLTARLVKYIGLVIEHHPATASDVKRKPVRRFITARCCTTIPQCRDRPLYV